MMKTKFFKGISAAFALVMVALATTFTACEKEEFNVDVKPANAQAVISPIVLFTDRAGNVTDVTNQSTFEPSVDKLVFIGNPALSAKTQAVTATYVKDGETYSSTINVTVPALLAGQYANITPTIMLQEKNSPAEITRTESTDTKNDKKEANIDNQTMSWWNNTTRTYIVKSGLKLAENGVAFEEGISAEAKAYIQNFANSIKNTYKEEEKTATFNVYANSRTTLSLVYKTVTTTYTFNQNNTKATVKLGTVKSEEYSTTEMTIEENKIIPGHGPTHGYGQGHGNDNNAGGGIIWAD